MNGTQLWSGGRSETVCFPGIIVSTYEQLADSLRERLVHTRIVRQQLGGREPQLLDPGSLCSLCSHTHDFRQRSVLDIRHELF